METNPEFDIKVNVDKEELDDALNEIKELNDLLSEHASVDNTVHQVIIENCDNVYVTINKFDDNQDYEKNKRER